MPGYTHFRDLQEAQRKTESAIQDKAARTEATHVKSRDHMKELDEELTSKFDNIINTLATMQQVLLNLGKVKNSADGESLLGNHPSSFPMNNNCEDELLLVHASPFDPGDDDLNLVGFENFLLLFKEDKTLLIQMTTPGSNRCAGLATNSGRIVTWLEGVTKTRVAELGSSCAHILGESIWKNELIFQKPSDTGTISAELGFSTPPPEMVFKTHETIDSPGKDRSCSLSFMASSMERPSGLPWLASQENV